MIKFKPNLDFVVIDRDAEKEISIRGIIIPDTSRESSYTGTVVAVGDGRYNEYGVLIPMTIKVGEKVSYHQNARSMITIEDKQYLILTQGEIFGTL